MPELGPYGSVRGARGNSRPYRESDWPTAKATLLTPTRRDGPADQLLLGSMQFVKDVHNLLAAGARGAHGTCWLP